MNLKRFITLFLLVCILSSFSHVSFAQQVTGEERAKLEAELKVLEAEIAAKEKELSKQKGNSKTLNNEVVKLKSQIEKSKLNIKAKNLQISKLNGQISSKSQEIDTLENKLGNQRQSLSQLIRKTNELDDTNMVHLILSGKDLSEFYSDIDSLSAIKKSLRSTVLEVKDTKEVTEEQKILLEDKHDEELNAKAELEKNKKQVESDEAYQKRLLSISKNKEKEFEKILAENQKKASQIKARLFNFAGGATSAIPFGAAVTYAENAERATGTPAALTLAILTQESALGANVGKCYLTDTTTGAGISTGGKVWKNVMKPTRDVAPFIEITGRLGMDYTKTVISCPIAGVAGWGGAMGPAQFIASTWKLIENRVAKSLGKSTSNPWVAADAIMASATYLSDLGANTSYASQIKAACKYYGTGGSSCSYGKSVMGRVSKIQEDIDYIKKYGVSNR
jgi:peptidoglycan hydrolase CwlO-like protein